MRSFDIGRLQRRQDFLRVQTAAKKFRGSYALLLVAARLPDVTRVGMTISRKVGNAVVRNRVRRRLREIVRQETIEFCQGHDYVIVVFPDAAHAAFTALQEDMTCLFQRAQKQISGKGR